MELVEFLHSRVVPVVLILVMFGLGLSLTLDDFKRVFAFPMAAAIGLGAQLIGVPLVAFVLAYMWAPTPAIAVGLVILAACPSGVTANAYSFASRADVALCVTLTAITSVITVLTIPFLTYLALQFFFEEGQVPDLPVAEMLRALAIVTVIPVSIGMTARAMMPILARWLLEPLRRVTLILLLFVIVGATLSGYEAIRENFVRAGLLVASMNLLTMGIGYGLARLARLPAAQVVTITFEVGVQNLTLALLVILTVLREPDLAIATLLYSAVMPVTALGFMYMARRRMLTAEGAGTGADREVS